MNLSCMHHINWTEKSTTYIFDRIRLLREINAFTRIISQYFPKNLVTNVDPSLSNQHSLISAVAAGLSRLG